MDGTGNTQGTWVYMCIFFNGFPSFCKCCPQVPYKLKKLPFLWEIWRKVFRLNKGSKKEKYFFHLWILVCHYYYFTPPTTSCTSLHSKSPKSVDIIVKIQNSIILNNNGVFSRVGQNILLCESQCFQ